MELSNWVIVPTDDDLQHGRFLKKVKEVGNNVKKTKKYIEKKQKELMDQDAEYNRYYNDMDAYISSGGKTKKPTEPKTRAQSVVDKARAKSVIASKKKESATSAKKKQEAQKKNKSGARRSTR